MSAAAVININTAPSNPGTSAASPKLAKAAREFEAILLQSWLEKMNQSFVGSEDSQDPGHDTLSSLGTQAIAGALAARGGIGIAHMILRQLQPASSPQEADASDIPAHQKSTVADSVTEGGRENPSSTLKSSHELPITELQGNTLSEVKR